MKQFFLALIVVSICIIASSELSARMVSVISHESSLQETPLTLNQIKALIENKTPDGAIVKEIRDKGIGFQLDEKILNDLKELGAKPKILQALKESATSNTLPREELPRNEFPYVFKIPTVDAMGNVTYQTVLPSRKYFEENLGDGVKLIMVEIPAGEFLMGTTKGEIPQVTEEYTKWYTKSAELKEARFRIKMQQPDHLVSVPTFYMSIFEITQEQWRQIAKASQGTLVDNPSEFGGQSDHPVENVSWKEAVKFCELLSEKTKRNYRLPSEAEWEYACRATTKEHSHFGFGDNITPDLVNYSTMFPWGRGVEEIQPKGETTTVGSYSVANTFGLFDMHGNVAEWVQDIGHPNYKDAPKDGRAWMTKGDPRLHIVRGGAWYNYAFDCRCADRNTKIAGFKEDGAIGFRVVLSQR